MKIQIMNPFKINLTGTVLFLCSLVFSPAVFAQGIKNFTTDPAKFQEEMKTFLMETDKKEGEKIMEAFELVWTAGKFNADQQQSIYKTSNAMLRKRMKAFPDFKNYILALTSFASSTQSAQSFSAWQISLDKLLLMPAKYFANYMVTCNNLFRSNTLYESVSTNWHSDNSNYSFDFDSIPKIVFPALNLVCTSKGDSSIIFATKGVLYPTRQVFMGSGGKVNWLRAGWDAALVHAELSNYAIDVTGSDFTADSVTFTNSTYFKQNLTGKYYDKILANVSPETATYPRFESYTTGLEIKNIVPDVHYRGGFSMIGNKMIGSGNELEDANLYFSRDKKLFLKVASKGFVVRKDKVTSDNASVYLYFEDDSIYHPGVAFKYIVKDREVALIRGEEGKSKSPYFDSFHQVDMYFDALYWKIDEPIINMKMISGVGESKATFESTNYFRLQRFLKLQGLNDVHPFLKVKQFAAKQGSNFINTEDLAKDMHLPVSEVRIMLMTFANQGFVMFDAANDRAFIKDRLNTYLLANSGKIDYDVIQFESIINALPNASINLLNFEITLRGLAPIVLSDSQNVIIYPKDQEVKLKKNRDFTFAGRVKAGRFDFFGKQFAFDYQNFKINLDNVDSLRLKVESNDPAEQDELGRRKLVPVRSVLQNISGDLLIDFQGNKSGMHEYPQYPIFNSKKDSYVYYDRPWIQEGVYTPDKFFFHLDPFTIDSLDNFSRAGLRFDGEFVSAGIFPDFRDTLRLQPDLSLGLVRETGDAGWPAYGGKGKFISTVKLSNEGLHGDGTIEYLTSTSKADDFLFLPDSMNSNVRSFVNRKEKLAGVEFPAVTADSVYEHWEPLKDVMYVNKKSKDLNMYESQALLNGNIQLKPSGMTGEGIMTFAASELESKIFKYKSNVFDADTADFRLTSDNTAALAFSTKNVNSHIDFSKRVGEFKSNGGGSYVSFPLNQYICYIDQFKWFMDQQEIELSSSNKAQVTEDTTNTGLSLTGSEFISVEARQDSLRFKAPFARYSLKDYLIKAEKVALIQTADASVIPDSGKVVVERYAKMRTLKDSRVIANNTTKYHTIYNADIDILGRKKYEGKGDYDYVDENKIKHHLHFDKIAVDTTFQTIADGELADTAGFPLSPQFLFKGSVHLTASKEFLNFTGYSKPNIHCEKIEKNWIRTSGDINPANVSITIASPVTDAGTKLAAAVAQTSDSTGIYAAFLMPKQKPSDLEIINASGVLYYDKTSNQFRITTPEKLEKPGIAGNYLSLDDSKCLVYGEGKLDFGSDFGQLSLKVVGNVMNNLNNDSTQFDVLGAVNFFFNEDAIKIMSEQISTNPSLLATQDVGRPTFEHGLAELVGKEKADKLIAELNLYGSFKKIPEDLRQTFFFTELKMAWNNETRSYRSIGPIGIGNIDKVSLNRKMNGYIEIIHKRTGDVLNIYLEPESGKWFYFSYARGLMQALSSYTTFNDVITKLKPEKRINKEKDKPDFEYILSTDRAVKNFLKRMQPSANEEDK
ncbi:MAG: hypothetical protein IPO49_09700 [Bacteroidetes bacterium]|nr:hypothetical protein [Bacteroidota bacterium]